MTLLLVATIVASSLELQAEVIDGHLLQVLLIPHGPVPIVTTTRTILGCYIEVDVLGSRGDRIGWLGPRASCATPTLSEFRALGPDNPKGVGGAEVFGARFDLLAPDRVRIGPNEEGFRPGQEYRLVIRYHDGDANGLSDQDKALLRKKYGRFWSGPIELEARPITFRCPS